MKIHLKLVAEVKHLLLSMFSNYSNFHSVEIIFFFYVFFTELSFFYSFYNLIYFYFFSFYINTETYNLDIRQKVLPHAIRKNQFLVNEWPLFLQNFSEE